MAANYSFSVILEPQTDGGFSVLVPALPEVVTEGDNEAEALANDDLGFGEGATVLGEPAKAGASPILCPSYWWQAAQ